MVATVAAVTVAAPAVIAGGLAWLGWGSGGVIGASIASGIQSTIGNVAAGSTFAAAQSAGAAGIATLTAAGAGATAGAGAAALGAGAVASGGTMVAFTLFSYMVWPIIGAYVGDWVEHYLFDDEDY